MSAWKTCLEQLSGELPPDRFSQWIRPLQAVESSRKLRWPAPHRFVPDWVNDKYLQRIEELLYAYRKVTGLCRRDNRVAEDHKNLLSILTM